VEHDGYGGTDSADDEIETLCQEALVLLEDADMRGARERAMEAVSLDDEHPFPIFVLGLIAEHEGDIPEARIMSELALRTAATNSDAIQLRVQVHLRENELAEAEQLLRFGIVHNPDDADLHEGLARVLLAAGRYEDALHGAEAALRLDSSNTGAMGVRTAALEQHADRATLLAVLRQTAQLFPDDPYALVELAAAEAEHGNVDRSRRLLARAHRLAPRDAAIADVRAMVEGVNARLVLKPLPQLLRWVREFPGGIAGFVLALCVAALPLREVMLRDAAAAPVAGALLGAWAAVALYVWLGPAVMGLRVNRIAASRARDEILEELTAPSMHGLLRDAPSPARVADAVGLLLAARKVGRARELLDLAAGALAEPASTQFTLLSRRLGRVPERLSRALLAFPGDRRLLVAAAVGTLLVAPTLTGVAAVPLVVGWGSAAAFSLLAMASAWAERRPSRLLDEALVTIAALEDR
jgi:tetratricopeptide (TPR) repeat protein